MATHYNVITDGTAEEIVAAFNSAFFDPVSPLNRLKVWSKKAQATSNYKWKPVSVQDAQAGARLVKGGLTELAATSKHGGGSVIGTTVGLGIQSTSEGRVAQLFLANYTTNMMVNQTGDVVKAYAKLMCDHLQAAGRQAVAKKR